REDKAVRRLGSPFAKTVRPARIVEGAVDLDRGQVPAGMGQLLRLRQPRRIEGAAPRREHPAADADANGAAVTHGSFGYKIAGPARKRESHASQSPSRSPRG